MPFPNGTYCFNVPEDERNAKEMFILHEQPDNGYTRITKIRSREAPEVSPEYFHGNGDGI